MHNFIKKSFKRQLLVCFMGVALLPLVLSGTFLIQMFKVKLSSDYQKKDREQAAAVEYALTDLFAELEEVTGSLKGTQQIIQALEGYGLYDNNTVYMSLYEKTVSLREAAQFQLYSADGSCRYSTGAGVLQDKLPAYWGILRVAKAHPEEMIIRRAKDYSGGSDILLRAARVLRDEKEECIGYVVVSMRAEHFEHILRGIYSSQDGICIVDSFWETVYSTGTAVQEEIGSVLRNRLLGDEGLTDTWNDNSIYLSALGDTGLSSILLRPEALTADTVRAMYNVMLLLAAVCLCLCVLVAERISNSLTRPLTALNRAMHEVQKGRLDISIVSERQDELGELSDSFNTMTVELQDYMERQVSQQKELNEVNIAMMQAQLNPHFLYNTLDTMKWVAKANHIPEIATLASKLAKILRTSISHAQFITLQEEMELVECYAQIQQIRFQGRFCFEYELPEELAACRIPKLIVQPIVENAVIHGLADCEAGHILTRAFLQDGLLHIEVTDDGCGIDEEVMKHLNSHSREQLTGHIGFYNVDTIIRLHYGEAYGLRVGKPDKGGARITIVIPAGRGGKEHAEGTGS